MFSKGSLPYLNKHFFFSKSLCIIVIVNFLVKTLKSHFNYEKWNAFRTIFMFDSTNNCKVNYEAYSLYNINSKSENYVD